MRFLLHGPVQSDVRAALARHEHACHDLLELSDVTDAPAEAASDPATLIPLLVKKQWNLVTTDSDFIRDLYEHKVEFGGVIIHILDNPDDLHDQDKAIDRLFERYKRLTAKRLYTVTPNRVKIRQLPGMPG